MRETKGVLHATIAELRRELEQVKAEMAADYERQSKIREAKLVAEIVRLKGLLEMRKIGQSKPAK